MSLTAGAQLGVYEIVSALGAGGMGEVYRAHDRKLGRDVAIKILPQAFVSDPDRVARFQREAKTLASLNHPHIGGIYGLEESGGVTALVMELVEGEDLAQRIGRGPIPIDEALPIATQIAEALEAAHEQGIMHRDLKPANIKVRADGTVKVLDFGLAKAMEPVGVGANVSQSPTITTPAMTGVGVILGTAAYMSPEQARGKPLDRRTDIWSFGCVLFEMLAGRTPFERGETVTDVVASIIKNDPDWQALPPDTPPHIRALLWRSLRKDPGKRLPHIGVARMEIDDDGGDGVGSMLQPPPQPVHRSHAPVAWTIAVLATVAAAVLGGLLLTRERPGTVGVVRFPVSLPDGMRFGSNISERGGGAPAPQFAVSPGGSWLAYVAYRSGEKPKLWVRRLDTLTPQELPDTDEASFPFWSPDGQFIAFFAQGKLKTIALSGGRPQIICDAPAGEGGTWNGAGDIVFARDQTSPLSRVAAAGGPVTLVTSLDAGTHDVSHRWPQFLPDGRRFIYLAMSGIAVGAENVLAIASLDSPAPTILVRGALRAQYASGYLLFPRQSTLMAQRFDVQSLRLTGDPQPVADQVALNVANGRTGFAVAEAGILAYRTDSLTDSSLSPRPLVWVDRNGHEEPIDAPRRAYLVARLSPDGTRIALAVRDEQNDIWIWDLARRTLQRLTTSRAGQPVWTPDGKRIAFTAERDGVQSMYWQAFDGSGTMERLSSGTQSQIPNSLSPDGTHLIFTTPVGPPFDLGVLALGATRTATMLLHSTASEINGELSPDGRWLAYESDESGRPEIYVRPFPDVESARRQVSTGGGTRPVWSRTGRELFYYLEPGTIMAVPVRLGADITLGRPQQVVTGEYAGPVNAWRHYDVSADGQRFLLLKNAPTPDGQKPAISQIDVVINWTEELKRLVPKH